MQRACWNHPVYYAVYEMPVWATPVCCFPGRLKSKVCFLLLPRWRRKLFFLISFLPPASGSKTRSFQTNLASFLFSALVCFVVPIVIPFFWTSFSLWKIKNHSYKRFSDAVWILFSEIWKCVQGQNKWAEDK